MREHVRYFNHSYEDLSKSQMYSNGEREKDEQTTGRSVVPSLADKFFVNTFVLTSKSTHNLINT